MLEAYFHDSGTHAGSPVMCVSGYLFNPRNARAVHKALKKKLESLRKRYPKIEFFHMKDLRQVGASSEVYPMKSDAKFTVF